jgi:hypothetical protein
MTRPRTVLFLCPHAAAKSVLAAAEFERLLDGARPTEAPAGTILYREGDAPRCGALLARLAFPLDDRWHALYGIDVPPCAPFHVMIVGGWGWSASPT